MSDETVGSGREQVERQQPESLRLRSLSAGLTVGDMDASLRHYVDGLGFVVEERWEEEGKLLGVMLLAGDCRLGVMQDDWKKGRDREKGIGFRVWAETIQDLDAIAARLAGLGIEHDGPQEGPWGRSLSTTDPDGFKMTLSNPQPEAG
ncbi:MAG TPA: VOC family protein [Thermoanaerobaculia bacterium]|nr:VOC family protein [Thermoanaerobaculia bacterium]